MRQRLARLAADLLFQDKYPALTWRVNKLAQRHLNGVPLTSPYGPKMMSRFGDGTWMQTMGGKRGISDHLSGLKAGDVFVDVGANDGCYALAASPIVGQDGLVLAFDPNPWVFRDLIANLALNDCQNVIAMNIAIGEPPGPTVFSHRVGQTGTGRRGTDAGDISWNAVIERIEPSSGIAAACAGRDLYIKIDVEGAEYQALQGLAAVLEGGNCRKLIVEIDEEHLTRYGHTGDDITRYVEHFGLRPTVNDDGGHYDEVYVPAAD